MNIIPSCSENDILFHTQMANCISIVWKSLCAPFGLDMALPKHIFITFVHFLQFKSNNEMFNKVHKATLFHKIQNFKNIVICFMIFFTKRGV